MESLLLPIDGHWKRSWYSAALLVLGSRGVILVAISCDKTGNMLIMRVVEKLNQKNIPLSLLIVFGGNYIVIKFSVCSRASGVKVLI